MSPSSPFQPAQADLAANRAGRLADSQRPTLQRQIRTTRWVYLGFCALFVGLAAPFTVAIDVYILLMTLPIIWLPC